MRSVTFDAGHSLRHWVVLELARIHAFLCLLVTSIQAQHSGGIGQQRWKVGVMGSVAPCAIFGCQMKLLLLSRHNDRPHFLVALLETKPAS